jgi:hypothetical protein
MDAYAGLFIFIAVFAFASVALATGSTASLRQRLSHRWRWAVLLIATLMWAVVLFLGFAVISYRSW